MPRRYARGGIIGGAACAAWLLAAGASAQTAADARLKILIALEHGASSAADLATLRSGTRSGNSDTARLAYRSLGRLERASLVPDILPGLRHALPEVRADAADALAQALNGDGRKADAARTPAIVATVQTALTTRLGVEADGEVRGVIRESLARLPYTRPADIAAAARTIRDAPLTDAADRLSTARALESLVRTHSATLPPEPDTIQTLRALAAGPLAGDARDARVRRVAAEALIAAHGVDLPVAERLMTDTDAQVRQRAMRAVAAGQLGDDLLRRGLADPAASVRFEALRALAIVNPNIVCSAALGAARDPDLTTALAAVDLLARCGESPDAMLYLESAVADRSEIGVARGWQRSAHALLALAAAAPERIQNRIGDYAGSALWPVRRYAARAAAAVGQRDLLERLAADPEPDVANAAREGLGQPRVDPAPIKPKTIAVSANELRHLASPRARITVRDVGRIEIALLTTEAPFTVLRFVELAQSGYYDGTAFESISVNSIAPVGPHSGPAMPFPQPEPGRWPHVRGTVALSSRESTDAGFFINLGDNPAFDHEYTIFGQVLNGGDVIDRILEGDIIDDVEILP